MVSALLLLFGGLAASEFPKEQGTNWRDSLGGIVAQNENFAVVKNWCSVPHGTLLYHASAKAITYDHAKPFFLTPDVVQAVYHGFSDVMPPPKEVYLYEFLAQALSPLIYFWKSNYGEPWHTPNATYVGVNTNIHQPLIDLVCGEHPQWKYSGQNPMGWRAPWDQDEILLCNSSVALIALQSSSVVSRMPPDTSPLGALRFGIKNYEVEVGGLASEFEYRGKRSNANLSQYIRQTYSIANPPQGEVVFQQNNNLGKKAKGQNAKGKGQNAKGKKGKQN